MANGFAYGMLLAWPVVVVVLYRCVAPERALIWSILGGFLVLPVGTAIDLPVIPALDKILIPSLAAFAMCLVLGVPAQRPGWLPETPPARALVLVYLLGPFATGLLNGAPTISGGALLPGLTLYDAASFASSHAVLLLPFLLGRRYLADPRAHAMLLGALMAAGLAYSIPILLEVRLSPQLHNWIYGFFPHSFLQQIRFGGFRPVVFLGHGLWVAFFMVLAVLAAGALWRAERGVRRARAGLALLWLGVVLVLCKSVAAGLLALALLPVVVLAGPRLSRLALTGLAVATLLYPVARGLDLVPTEALTDAAAGIAPDRAASLAFRFENEDMLLARAAERPVFGWGGWGRARIYDADRRDVSVSDGRWIITVGAYGWAGYAAEFGLLVLGLLALARAPRGTGPPPFASMALAALLAVNLVYLMPNGFLTPLAWLMAGALLGQAEARRRHSHSRNARRDASGMTPA